MNWRWTMNIKGKTEPVTKSDLETDMYILDERGAKAGMITVLCSHNVSSFS